MSGKIDLERLLLRSVRWSDLRFYWKLSGNGIVRAHLGGPQTWQCRLSTFQKMNQPSTDACYWVAAEKTHMKTFGLFSIDRYKGSSAFELSYQVLPDYWGKGLAYEACLALVQYGFNELKLRQLVAETQSRNTRSIRLLTRLEFSEINRFERYGSEQCLFFAKAENAKGPPLGEPKVGKTREA